MKECILVSNNMVRDAKRDVSRALRESQRDRLAALDAFAQGMMELKTLRAKVKELEAHVDGPLRAAAKEAGNTASDIRNAERIVNGFYLKEEFGRDGAEAVMDGSGTAGPEWQESTEGE